MLVPELLTRAAVLMKRVNITVNRTSPEGALEAMARDPWVKSGKYALGWVYFAVILLIFASLLHVYHLFSDMVRAALFYRESREHNNTTNVDYPTQSPVSPDEGGVHYSDAFPKEYGSPVSGVEPASAIAAAGAWNDPSFLQAQQEHQIYLQHYEEQQQRAYRPPPDNLDSFVGTIQPVNVLIALFRTVFYRPIPDLQISPKLKAISFPSLAVICLVVIATVFTFAYSFAPQPLFWQDIQYGSPPLAVRAGMLAIALIPWIVALSMKANFISLLTGIGHERLGVLHRWLAYICLGLAIVHMVPFYITPIDSSIESRLTFEALLTRNGDTYVYSTGIAAFVPLAVLCVHSVPVLRRKAYEFFVICHIPISVVFIGMLFWHCNNYLTSWHYLISTVAIWGASLLYRLAFLNWSKPWKLSWIVGDESAITILPENAIKITVPTQMKWRPGQYVYIRMPGLSLLENHPFTIASLCSDDFPSDYGDGYHDMLLVFRPFGGFTRKVLDTALLNGPWQTYRAFIDGPYGGMQRRIESFDTVVLVAGGSGITSIVSQLLYLIKRMRDGKAATKKVMVIWSLRRPETFEWFKEELKICREFAPPDTVSCRFFITSPQQTPMSSPLEEGAHQPFPPSSGPVTSPPDPSSQSPSAPTHNRTNPRPLSTSLHGTVNEIFQNLAEKRLSGVSQLHQNASNRNSQIDPATLRQSALLDEELQREGLDSVMPLPEEGAGAGNGLYPLHSSWAERRRTNLIATGGTAKVGPPGVLPPPRTFVPGHKQALSLDIDAAISASATAMEPASAVSLSAISATSTTTFGLAGADHRPKPAEDESKKLSGHSSTPTRNVDGRTPTEFQRSFMRFAFLSPSTTVLPRTDLRRKGSIASSILGTSPSSSGPRSAVSITPFWKSKPRGDDPEIQLSSPSESVPEPKPAPGVVVPPAWSVELGRPDLARMLRTSAPYWGRRTCVFVCGPPRMRIDVAAEVAKLQSMVVFGKVPGGNGLAQDVVLPEKKAEVFLHTDNYWL